MICGSFFALRPFLSKTMCPEYDGTMGALKNSIVLITGSSRGIGAATAKAFALFIAESKPAEKEDLIALITNLIG